MAYKEEHREIMEYLDRYRGDSEAKSLILRAGNALLRYDVTTMSQAAQLTDEKIARMRGVGDKTKEFIRQVIEDYKREDQNGQ